LGLQKKVRGTFEHFRGGRVCFCNSRWTPRSPIKSPRWREARALITELRTEFQQSLQAALQVENQLLRKKLELFLQRYFGGTKNESLDPKQLELLLAGLTALSAPTPGGGKANSGPGDDRRAFPCGSPCLRTWRPSAWCWNR
jgi:hypothetical protein